MVGTRTCWIWTSTRPWSASRPSRFGFTGSMPRASRTRTRRTSSPGRSDGSAVVVDCRPVERRRPRDVAKFEATARACALAGWEYRLLGEVDALVTANLRWLAGYRHPRHHLAETVDVLRRVFATPTPLMAGAAAAGDPIAVVPVLFHLLWCHELTIDLSTPLHQATLVSASAGQR